MNKNSKGIVQILILVILGLIGLVGFVILKQSNLSTKLPSYESVSPTPDSTSNWETYTNDKLGFSFKYPSDYFKFKEEFPNIGVYLAPSKGEGGNGPKFLKAEDVWLDVSVSSGANLKSLDDYLSIPGQQIFPANTEKTKTTIDGVDGYIIVYSLPISAGNITQYSKVGIVLSNEKIYTISLSAWSQEVLQPNQTMFDQLLSTFKFPLTQVTLSPQTSLNYSAPTSWKKYKTATGLTLCLPLKWESGEYGELTFNRDPDYKPTITYLENIPYSGGSRREAYFKFWENEYPNVRSLVTISEKNINGSSVLTIYPANTQESKTSPEGLTVLWYANGKLWKAAVSNWSQINDSQSAFLNDFYTMISCSL